jgi:hypothetical protein
MSISEPRFRAREFGRHVARRLAFFFFAFMLVWGGQPALAQLDIKNPGATRDQLAQDADALTNKIDLLEVFSEYCDSEDRVKVFAKYQALVAEANALQQRMQDAHDQAMEIGKTLGGASVWNADPTSGLYPNDQRFWNPDTTAMAKVRQALDRKLQQIKDSKPINCTPSVPTTGGPLPGPTPPPHVSPLAGVNRPAPFQTPTIPKAPKAFCTVAQRAAAIDAADVLVHQLQAASQVAYQYYQMISKMLTDYEAKVIQNNAATATADEEADIQTLAVEAGWAGGNFDRANAALGAAFQYLNALFATPVVDCSQPIPDPNPGPGPQHAPPPKTAKTWGEAHHRVTSCPYCADAAKELNAAIDDYNFAVGIKSADDLVDNFYQRVLKLSAALDQCEASDQCRAPVSQPLYTPVDPGPPPGGSGGLLPPPGDGRTDTPDTPTRPTDTDAPPKTPPAPSGDKPQTPDKPVTPPPDSERTQTPTPAPGAVPSPRPTPSMATTPVPAETPRVTSTPAPSTVATPRPASSAAPSMAPSPAASQAPKVTTPTPAASTIATPRSAPSPSIPPKPSMTGKPTTGFAPTPSPLAVTHPRPTPLVAPSTTKVVHPTLVAPSKPGMATHPTTNTETGAHTTTHGCRHGQGGLGGMSLGGGLSISGGFGAGAPTLGCE